MAVEPRRGCGYRRAGGLYLVADGLGEPCERLPLPIKPCAVCGACVRQTRSWQWISIGWVLGGAKACVQKPDHCPRCPVCSPELFKTADPPDRAGLTWVGEKFYKTPDAWAEEAFKMGISKRISTIPKGFVLGKTWVFVAHPLALPGPDAEHPGFPGVFHVFRPSRLELVVTPSMKSQKWVKELQKDGATLVEVPENDPDHAPAPTRKSARKRAMDRLARKAQKAQEAAEEETEEDDGAEEE